MPANRYGTSITRQQTDANTLLIEEDITFNNAHVGGVRVTFTFRAPDAQKLSGFNPPTSTATATRLDQTVDLTYNGVVFMTLHVSAQPDPTLPSGHSIDIETAAANVPQPPLSLQTERLA